MSYSILVVSALFMVSYGTFTKLPTSYTTAERISACQDYCKGQSISTTTGFDFQGKGWELCSCPIAQGSGQWVGTGCYTECWQRCQAGLGSCANPSGANYTGVCCSTADNNATIQSQCYETPNGACYQNGSG
ncbi:unnamed protein product, partial [Mesorhabditis belari]|uniref:Uncharacterized protein n=1 Tax=Mesorhabditis belari TaxID=2138241 RepID=A0AAF3EDW3_9BILA